MRRIPETITIDKEKLEEEIVIMKKSITKLVHEKDKEYIGLIEKWNQKVVLAVAGFKCQKCGKRKNLQVHHLIQRKAKEYMDFWRYASQRYYWANQIILCAECHVHYHKNVGIPIPNNNPSISKERIKEVKEFFK